MRAMDGSAERGSRVTDKATAAATATTTAQTAAVTATATATRIKVQSSLSHGQSTKRSSRSKESKINWKYCTKAVGCRQSKRERERDVRMNVCVCM